MALSSGIKVLFYPYGEKNPYQLFLAESLRQHGAHVSGHSRLDMTLPYLDLLRAGKGYNVIHFHWISGLYTGKTKLRFFIRTLLFATTIITFRFLGKRVVLTMHNLIPHETTNHIKWHVRSRRLISVLVNRIIVHSTYAAEETISSLKVSRKKLVVIPHGHYRDYYPDTISAQEARKILDIENNHRVVLFFGAIREYKGISEIINYARTIPQNDVTIVIAGNPDRKFDTSIFKELPSSVRLHLGFIPDRDVQTFFKAADCFLLPYRESLTSGAAMLGLSFYLPIVATNSPSFRHLIDIGLCAPCEPETPSSIHSAINDVLSWDRRDFRNNCDKFIETCSKDRIGQDHLQAYLTGS